MQLELRDKIFKYVSQAGDELNLPTYVVGGYVRDLLLGRHSKDLDFVCVGDGMELAKKTAELLPKKVKVNYFKNYGTAQFHWRGGDYEFVGARKESYKRESRNPEVEAGSLEDDQNRRDFTINAMAIQLNSEQFGQLIDPFGGQTDLKNGIIRTPLDPDITFSDDPLRMMRAIRFASQLGFTIEPVTNDAICRNANRIEIISQERITDELNKIVLSPVPSVGFKLLFRSGLLQLIFPEMVALQGVEVRNKIGHKDNFYHTIQVLDNISKNTDDLWLRWAAILHDIAKPATKRFDKKLGWTFHGHEFRGSKMVPKIFKRLKLPLNQKMKFVQKLVLLHLRPIGLNKEDITDSAIRRLLFDAGEDIDSLMTLCEADITSKNKDKVQRYLKNFRLVREKLIEIEEKDRIKNFQPPVDGKLIMDTFQIGPQREIGIIKSRIKEAILEGTIDNDFDQAHALMLKIGKELNLVPSEKV